MEKGIKCTYITKFDTLFEQNQQVSLKRYCSKIVIRENLVYF